MKSIGLKPDALHSKLYDESLERRTLQWFLLGLQGAGGCMLTIPTANAALRGIMTIVAHTILGLIRLQGDRCTDHRGLATTRNAAWKSNCHGDVKGGQWEEYRRGSCKGVKLGELDTSRLLSLFLFKQHYQIRHPFHSVAQATVLRSW